MMGRDGLINHRNCADVPNIPASLERRKNYLQRLEAWMLEA
jgi:hypothetical protein